MADKTKTIKNATDKELDELLIRLRKERELQSIIADIKQRASNVNEFTSYDRLQISTEEAIEALYHFGILGMHWGRRKGNDSIKADKKWRKSLSDSFVKAHNMSTNEMNTFLDKLNADPKYDKIDMWSNGGDPKKWSPITKAYVKEYDTKYEGCLNRDLKKLGLDISPSGKERLTIRVKDTETSFEISKVDGEEIQHFIGNVINDADKVLQHFGIPGMRWGRRKIRKIESVNKAKAEKLKAETSEDAAKKNQLQKKKMHELSNAELKALTTRLQLEKQYRDLTKAELSPGKKFIMDALLNSGKQTAGSYATKAMTKGVESALKMAVK